MLLKVGRQIDQVVLLLMAPLTPLNATADVLFDCADVMRRKMRLNSLKWSQMVDSVVCAIL